MANATEFQSGDHVSWQMGAGRTTGCVLRSATCRLGVSGKTFEASRQAPQLLVRRDDDGKLIVLAPGAVHLLPN